MGTLRWIPLHAQGVVSAVVSGVLVVLGATGWYPGCRRGSFWVSFRIACPFQGPWLWVLSRNGRQGSGGIEALVIGLVRVPVVVALLSSPR